MTARGLLLSLLLLAPAAVPVRAGEPTPEETLTLELINRLRADPAGEGARMAVKAPGLPGVPPDVDFKMFNNEMQALKPAPPLVFHSKLVDAARRHARYMIANGQSHQEDPSKAGFSGVQSHDRIKAAGYPGTWSGENIGARAILDEPWFGLLGFVVDWGPGGTGGMQPGRGHRVNLLKPEYREIGVAVVPAGEGRHSVVHDFADRDGPARLAGGVVYVDANGNGTYDLGEGVGGVTIAAADGATTTTWAAGGYALTLKKAGAAALTARYEKASTSKSFPAGRENVKFDWAIDLKVVQEKADRLLAAVEKAGPPEGDAHFKAAVALLVGTEGLPLDAERKQKIDEAASKVGGELAARRKAVLDALADFKAPDYAKAVRDNQKPYAGTAAAGWFKDAQAAGGAKQAALDFELQAKVGKPVPKARQALIAQLEAAAQQVATPAFRDEISALAARVEAAGGGR